MFSLRDLCFVLLTYYARKGSWAFYLHYPQINAVGKSEARLELRMSGPYTISIKKTLKESWCD